MASRLQFLPLVLFIMFPVSFMITYAIAVSKGHIKAFYSYISDTGTLSPESCFFSLFLNLTAVVLGFVVYIRYKQNEEYFRNKTQNFKCANVLGLVLGMIAALGVCFVGCFQESNILIMHIVGAFGAFLGGSLYMSCQAYMTFKMLPMFTNTAIAVIRLIIGVSTTILFIITFACAVISMAAFYEENPGGKTLLWESHHAGWELHVLSVVAEWLMAGLFDVYILTFMLDFRHISMDGPKFRIAGLRDSNGNANGGGPKASDKFIKVKYGAHNQESAA